MTDHRQVPGEMDAWEHTRLGSTWRAGQRAIGKRTTARRERREGRAETKA